MVPVEKLLFTVVAAVIPVSLWKILRIIRSLRKSSFRHLHGPKGTSLIFGNFPDMTKDENISIIESWINEHGDTFRVKGLLNSNRLFTVDTRTVQHIITHSDIYQQPTANIKILTTIFGDGGLAVVGDAQHRQQRRVMNPAFGWTQIRALTEAFFEKAILLRDVWSSEITKDPITTMTGARIDAALGLNKAMLEIISLTGFNYDLNALRSNEQGELAEAYSILSMGAVQITPFDILQATFPVLQLIPNTRARKLQSAQSTMTQIGEQLLRNAKADALAGATENGVIEKDRLRGRDLFSLLVKANMATDIPESQKLTDDEVIAQVITFFFAGHETTSSTLTWALYALTQAPEVQKKLRDELLSVETDTPSMDKLMALPYLDAVLREVLRLHPVARSTGRRALMDDVLPLKTPVTDRYGVVHDTIPIAKGESIYISMEAINRSKAIWGLDAHEFKPERWYNVPESAAQVPGLWGNSMSFLGGPRGCIGFRFAIAAAKAILFSLVRAFEFELAVPVSQIGPKVYLGQRPVLRDDPNGQLPLLVKSYQRT